MIDIKSSRKQALRNVLAALDAGQLGAFRDGSCMYENLRAKDDQGRYCSVGVLFTSAQRADIRRRGLNHNDIVSLAEKIGQENVETVTGMPLDDLLKMQQAHDASFDRDYGDTERGSTFRDFLLARIAEA